MWVNWNGALQLQEAIAFDSRDRGYLLGDGLFETIRYYPSLQNPLPLLTRHWQRLSQSAEALGLPLPVDSARLQQDILKTITANGFMADNVRIRITLSRGPAPSGLQPVSLSQSTLLITTEPFSPSQQAISVYIANTRRNEQSLSARLKSLSYIDNLLARREAAQKGADEAVMCNTRATVAGGSCHNLFMVANDTLVTPPIDDGALPGVTRSLIIDLCQAVGIPLVEQSISCKALYNASEVFLSNALHGIRPVSTLDNKMWLVGSYTQKLMDYYTQWLIDENSKLRSIIS